MTTYQQTIEKILANAAPAERVKVLQATLDELATTTGGLAKAVKTEEGRAIYNAIEVEKNLRGCSVFAANEVRKMVNPDRPTGSREELQAEFDRGVKKHMADHGIADRHAAAVAFVKTARGRALYGAIDTARGV